jgi:hypothetical protein
VKSTPSVECKNAWIFVCILHIVTCLLKAVITDKKRLPLLGSGSINTFPGQPTYVTAVTITYATIEELLETLSSVVLVQRLYNEI